MTNSGPDKEMPRYKCYKEVHALKIRSVENYGPATPERAGFLVFEEPSFADLDFSQEYKDKHNPRPGGYYVVYKDGYKSFSPAKAFEEGYTQI